LAQRFGPVASASTGLIPHRREFRRPCSGLHGIGGMSKAAVVLKRGDRVATFIWIARSLSRNSPGRATLLYAMPVDSSKSCPLLVVKNRHRARLSQHHPRARVGEIAFQSSDRVDVALHSTGGFTSHCELIRPLLRSNWGWRRIRCSLGSSAAGCSCFVRCPAIVAA
jgi:hypothetical protein